MGRAIVREPKAFLMDEPLSNLDAKLRVEMRAVVSRLQQRLDTTTVYVTHDQTEAMTLGHRVAVMRAGILQQVAAPKELYENPRNLFVAGFIGSPAMNFFSGHMDSDSIKTPMGAIPLDDELRRSLERHGSGAKAVIVGIRPEDFEDAQFAPEGHVGWEFDATIELTESMGSEIYAHFDFEGGDEIDAEELRELQEDAGTSDVPGSASGHAVARVDAQQHRQGGTSAASCGSNVQKLHLFDPVRRRLDDAGARHLHRRTRRLGPGLGPPAASASPGRRRRGRWRPSMSPPCARASRRAMARPSPVPPVAGGPRAVGAEEGLEDVRRGRRARSRARRRRPRRARRRSRVARPRTTRPRPWRMALSSRLVSTRSSASASPRTVEPALHAADLQHASARRRDGLGVLGRAAGERSRRRPPRRRSRRARTPAG